MVFIRAGQVRDLPLDYQPFVYIIVIAHPKWELLVTEFIGGGFYDR
jgi:hypothetical protein